MIEEIVHEGLLHAIIIRADFHEPGVHFFTPGDFSQQLAYMSRPTGHLIEPHFHRVVQRNVQRTLEVLFVRRGRVRADLYTSAGERIGSRVLGAGDVILLAAGGHGFEILEDAQMFEVKQGPYLGDGDKVRFTPAETESS